MLGKEPNQGRVISKNHSMKCKLGTVQVWTGEGFAPQQRSEPKTKRDQGGRLVTYVPVCACVLESRRRGVVVWVRCRWSWFSGSKVLWPASLPAARCPSTQSPSHAAGMTGPSSLVWSLVVQRERTANRPPP